MGGSEEPSIEFAGKDGHGDPIWGKKEMAAHRWVSRRARGWRVESSSRRSYGWSLVDCDAARSAHELATVSSLRARFWRERRGREEMDASTPLGPSPWRTCMRWKLTSEARSGVWVPNVAIALSPVGHVGELKTFSDKTMAD